MKQECVSTPGQLAAPDYAGVVEALLGQAEQSWRRGGAAGLGEAVRACEQLLAVLPEAARVERARVWLRRGQFLESARTEEALAEAVRSHEAGLASLGAGFAAGAGVIFGEANAVPARLQALLWMNRGNALLAFAQTEHAREARRSYDAVLALLAREGDGSGRGPGAGEVERSAMLGAAWLNRAEAARLAAGEAITATAEEAECLDHAIRELGRAAEAGSGPARRNLAGAWLNRAAWCRRAGDGAGARAAWGRAVAAAEPEAARDLVALETGLRARHALCVDAARRLAAGEALSASEEGDLLAQVEGGLADFATGGGAARSSGVAEAAERLFEFGAWFLRTRSPRRLPAYLARHVEAGGAARLAGVRLALEMARQEILRTGFAELLSEEGREARERLAALGAVEGRLIAREHDCSDKWNTK